MKEFKGRPVVAGTCTAPALVSHSGFNTLASFQGALQFGDVPVIGNKYKQTECDDQNNKDLSISLKMKLIDELCEVLRSMDKTVKVTYF